MMKGLGNFFRSVVLPKTDKLDLTDVSKGIAQQVVNKTMTELERRSIKHKEEFPPGAKPKPSSDWLDGGVDYRAMRREELARANRMGVDLNQQQWPANPSPTSQEQVKASISQFHENARKKRRIVSETHPDFPSPDETDEEFEERRVEQYKERARLAKERKRLEKEAELRAAEEAEAQRQIRELELLEAQAAYEENPKFGLF